MDVGEGNRVKVQNVGHPPNNPLLHVGLKAKGGLPKEGDAQKEPPTFFFLLQKDERKREAVKPKTAQDISTGYP